jgi:uncharacterized UBP type Zn finger protein
LTKIISSINPASKTHVCNEERFIVASADNIRANVDILSPAFTIGQQEDASLFTVSLLDHCTKCLTSHESIFPTVVRPQTVIHQIFGIQLLSTIQCSLCLKTSSKEEVTHMLPVEINNTNDLSKALAHFVDEEILIGANAYRCSYCNDLVKARKRLTIHKLSPILIINLKRSIIFDGSSRKLSHQVNYNEVLDLSPYMTCQQLDSNEEGANKFTSYEFLYKLYAVITHYGDNLEGGHYCAYIRTQNDRWFLVDDAQGSHVSSSEVLNNTNAFVLFYAKTYLTIPKTSTTFEHQPPRTLPTENNILAQSSSIFDVSVRIDCYY